MPSDTVIAVLDHPRNSGERVEQHVRVSVEGFDADPRMAAESAVYRDEALVRRQHVISLSCCGVMRLFTVQSALIRSRSQPEWIRDHKMWWLMPLGGRSRGGVRGVR